MSRRKFAKISPAKPKRKLPPKLLPKKKRKQKRPPPKLRGCVQPALLPLLLHRSRLRQLRQFGRPFRERL